MSENEATTTNALSNPGAFVKVDGEESNPTTTLGRYAQADVEFSEKALAANAPEDGVEESDEESEDVPDTGEDEDWDNGEEDDEDDEDEDEDDEEEDEEYRDKSIENL